MKNKLAAAIMSAAAATAIVVGTILPTTPVAAIPVFDVSNYAQNLLIAARTLRQVNQQIQSLQNEAAMLSNMAKHLQKVEFPELTEITRTLQEVDRLMGQAQGIDFRVDALDAKFRTLFPGTFDQAAGTDRRIVEAKARLDTAMSAFRNTMAVQSQVIQNIQGDTRLLADLVARSQGAEGGLQAQQATNQLLALAAKQHFQLQTMMAAQFRSESMERARRAQAEIDARAATTRFLGSGTAYTPR